MKCPHCNFKVRLDPLIGTGTAGSVYCPFCGLTGPRFVEAKDAVKLFKRIDINAGERQYEYA